MRTIGLAPIQDPMAEKADHASLTWCQQVVETGKRLHQLAPGLSGTLLTCQIRSQKIERRWEIPENTSFGELASETTI